MPQAVLNTRKSSARFRQRWSRICSPVVFLAARELLALASLAVGLGLGLIALAEGMSRLGAV